MPEQEQKECLFCLEVELGHGRRKTVTIWYMGLYPCECRFASHWQCLLKWQWQCDDVLQCPICRKEVLEPDIEEETEMPDSARIFVPEQKCSLFTFLCYAVIVYMFLGGLFVLSARR